MSDHMNDKLRNLRDELIELERQRAGNRILTTGVQSAISRQAADLAGQCAQLEGRPRDSNPNRPGTVEWMFWESGWKQQRDDMGY
jgi:hypothetical protein